MSEVYFIGGPFDMFKQRMEGKMTGDIIRMAEVQKMDGRSIHDYSERIAYITHDYLVQRVGTNLFVAIHSSLEMR